MGWTTVHHPIHVLYVAFRLWGTNPGEVGDSGVHRWNPFLVCFSDDFTVFLEKGGGHTYTLPHPGLILGLLELMDTVKS